MHLQQSIVAVVPEIISLQYWSILMGEGLIPQGQSVQVLVGQLPPHVIE